MHAPILKVSFPKYVKKKLSDNSPQLRKLQKLHVTYTNVVLKYALGAKKTFNTSFVLLESYLPCIYFVSL